MRFMVFVFVLCLAVFECLVASGMCEWDFKFRVQTTAHHDMHEYTVMFQRSGRPEETSSRASLLESAR